MLTESQPRRWQAAAFALLLVCSVSAKGQDAYVPSKVLPPAVSREMRGVWIATVANIDWPSTNAVSSSAQRRELLSLLDKAAELKLNAVLFQVRPACDAMYASRIEPWSEYLTGTMGKAPEPYFDPLAFAIEEAHKRGLELHAWFNPFRARHVQARSPVSAMHVSRTHPEWVRHYGNALWLDPGEKAAREYSLRVVMDVVTRYEIDGVHFDDYFYPYPEHNKAGADIEFPDEASWRRYGARSKLTRDDWRRQNVNDFVHQVGVSIKAAKPWVKFGISPFGIWRPGNPATIKGLDAFAELHADSRKWLASGWVDYLTPQLYWGINPPETSFPTLLSWWAEQNSRNRLLCPGVCVSNVGNKWNPQEILRQVEITRRQAGAGGHVLWGMKTIMRDESLSAQLQKVLYSETAAVPQPATLHRARPSVPQLRAQTANGRLELAWTVTGREDAETAWWILHVSSDGKWTTRILPHGKTSVSLTGSRPQVVALTAQDRYGALSTPAVLERANLRVEKK